MTTERPASHTLRQLLLELQDEVRKTREAWRAATTQARDAARTAGIERRKPVIDVGDAPRSLSLSDAVSALVRLGLGGLAVGLVVSALLALAAFVVQAFIALLLLSRVLGLRVSPTAT